MHCPHCTSNNVYKNGIRVRREGCAKQEYHCQECAKYFSVPYDGPDRSLRVLEDIEPGQILDVKFDELRKLQIRDNAIEACRQSVSRKLEKTIPK